MDDIIRAMLIIWIFCGSVGWFLISGVMGWVAVQGLTCKWHNPHRAMIECLVDPHGLPEDFDRTGKR